MRTLFGRKRFTLIAAAVASIFGMGVAQAGPIFTGPPTAEIKVSDGVTTVTCFDNDPCDSDANTGVVHVSLPMDGWFVNVDIGLTKDVLGNATSPHMDMAYQVAYLGAAKVPGDGTLTISFSDTGFLHSPLAFTGEIGGTQAGGITQSAFADFAGPGNTLFDTSNPLCGRSFTGSPFSGSCTGNYSGATPYSLTETITLTNLRQVDGQASGDHGLTSVPEPGTLMLLGGALAGFGFFSRRRNTRS